MTNIETIGAPRPRPMARIQITGGYKTDSVEPYLDSTIPIASERERNALLQEALTHQLLKALAPTFWDVSGLELMREVIQNRYGHRDGAAKDRRPPPELRLFHCVSWDDLAPSQRMALIESCFEYLDINDERGPNLCGANGWEAISAACDLIIRPPQTVALLDEFIKRAASAHPAIERRIDRVRRCLSVAV